MTDTLLTISGQVLAFMIVGIGFVTTLYPLAENRHKILCLCGFIVIGMGVGAVSTIQSNRSADAQAELQNQLAQVRSENQHEFSSLQTRLDSVVAAVQNSPRNVDIAALAQKVTQLAVPPAPPGNLTITVQ